MFGQIEGKGSVACGMMLLGMYLVFDSFTSQWQSRMFTKHRVSSNRPTLCKHRPFLPPIRKLVVVLVPCGIYRQSILTLVGI